VDRTISVAVVGAGWAGAHRHAPAFAANPLAHLAGVCDPMNLPAAQHVADPYGASVYASLDELLASDVELVSICTPPGSHVEICERALSAGKHVLVEKPIALTSRDASRLDAMASERNVALCPCHNLLFLPAVLAARDALTSLGEIVSATAYQWNRRGIRTAQWTHDITHGHFVEDAPHGLYLLRHFLGDLRVEHAQERASRAGMDWVDVGLDAGGRSASLLVGSGSPIRTWAVMLVCENGVLVVDVHRNMLLRIPADDAAHRAGSRAIAVAGQIAGWAFKRIRDRRRLNGHETLIARLLESIRDGSPPPVRATDGVDTVALTEHAVALLDQSA